MLIEGLGPISFLSALTTKGMCKLTQTLTLLTVFIQKILENLIATLMENRPVADGFIGSLRKELIGGTDVPS